MGGTGGGALGESRGSYGKKREIMGNPSRHAIYCEKTTEGGRLQVAEDTGGVNSKKENPERRR